MESTLQTRVREILEAEAGGAHVVPLASLESGAILGLDAELRWVLTPSDVPAFVYGPDTAHRFCEVLEIKRDDFEGQLETGARELGLPELEVVHHFPAVGIISAVLAKNLGFLSRMALLWARPSELRELRPAIVAVTKTPNMPGDLKILATRLIVPEQP